MNFKKCAIIGCGFVGATIAFSFVKSGLFSELVLIDMNEKRAMGEAMDLSHCIAFARPMKVYSGSYKDIADCGLVVIAAGANQQPGETRPQLLSRNVKIIKSITEQIIAVNKDCIILVVTNPVDALTQAVLKFSGFDSRRVIGSGTVLDTARFKYLLGEHLGVDVRNIHAFIIGEHGDSELAVWSSANVSGIDLNDFCKLCGKCDSQEKMHELHKEVVTSAYKIIEGKGATYYGIAMAVLRIAESIVRNEHSVLTVSTAVNGHYGINGLCLGVPAILGANGIERVLDIPLDHAELMQLRESASQLEQQINQIL